MFRNVLVAAAASVFSLVVRADIGGYRVDFLGERWDATGLNEFGDVCGNYQVDGTRLLAGVSRGGAPFELLPLPEGMQTSRTHAINDAGVIVGAVCPNEYVITQPTAAVWRPSGSGYTVEVLGGLPGDLYSAAYAINNLGDMIGASGFWGWNLATGVIFLPEGPEELPGGFRGTDINDQRVVLSGLDLLDLEDGTVSHLSLPPGNWQGFGGAALNDQGDVCGSIIGYSGCSTFPMRFRQGVGWEYLGGCATTTSATSINNHGDALLYYYFTASAVNFVPEGHFSLGSLIDPSQGEWQVQWSGAAGINDARQIVCSARRSANGPIGAVLLSPLTSCRADFNGDGSINTLDVLAFLNAWSAGDPTADFNDDGTVNTLDVLAFLNSWSAGC